MLNLFCEKMMYFSKNILTNSFFNKYNNIGKSEREGEKKDSTV